MKKTSTLFLFFLLTGSLLFPGRVSAQAPDKMSYQAVIRDASGNLVTEQAVGLRVSILQNSIDGILVYQEIYNPNPETNKNGLLTIEIGAGVPLTGTFSEIDWSAGPYFIKTETDPSGGTDYTITGTSQLLSVPYALHSGTSDVLIGEITESQISDLQDYLTNKNSVGDLSDVNLPPDIKDGKILKYYDHKRIWGVADDLRITEETDPTWIGDADETGNIGRTGFVGIGTTSPAEGLHIDETNFAVTGTYNSGPSISLAGSGTRMFFYPRKAAFRAGRVTGEEWNDANIGNYSTALGYNITASGIYTTALGNNTTASGNYSTAMGSNTTASGDISTAMGAYARAVGDYSFAINLSSVTGPEVPAQRFQISGASAIGGNRA